MKLHTICGAVAAVGFFSANLLGAEVDYKGVPPELLEQISRREAQLAAELKVSASDRTRGVSDDKAVAALTVLTEMAIQERATALGIKVTEEEALGFIYPQLVRQGIVDGTGSTALLNDPNLKSYLKAQGWTTDQMATFARSLLLWTRIVTKDIKVSQEEVVAYLKDHPGLGVVAPRLQLTLREFVLPQDEGIRSRSAGAPNTETLTAFFALTRSAGNLAMPEGEMRKKWQDLNLFLPLDRLDPTLRESLAGKKVGDDFGPVTLHNGVIVSGKLTKLHPQIDITGRKEFVEYATLLTALKKADQEKAFKDLIDKSFVSNPTVSRLWQEILGLAGTGVGAIFGAPQVGGVIGGAVGGWVDNRNARPAPTPTFSQPQWNQQVPQMVANHPPASFPPNFSPQGFPQMFHQANFQPPAFVPPMPPQYMQSWIPQNLPPPSQYFLPPFAMPMMFRY